MNVDKVLTQSLSTLFKPEHNVSDNKLLCPGCATTIVQSILESIEILLLDMPR